MKLDERVGRKDRRPYVKHQSAKDVLKEALECSLQDFLETNRSDSTVSPNDEGEHSPKNIDSMIDRRSSNKVDRLSLESFAEFLC